MTHRSLTGRIAWAAALAAGAAALVAAIATSTISAFLLQRAEDRRLHEAAVILADELDEGPPTNEHIKAVVLDEVQETDHTGLLFAVFDGNRRLVAGEDRLQFSMAGPCATYDGRLRACSARSSNGLHAVAASNHTSPSSLFIIAAFVAALLAGIAAWLASRPLSRTVVAPLARLRSRLADLDVDAEADPDLGPDEHVLEVDELRTTLVHLLGRVNDAIEQARRFAANAAHELRTPLTTVRAELELLAEDAELVSNTRENVLRAGKKISDLAVLVERLLVLATPRNSPRERLEVVSLRDLVDDTISTLQPEERERVTAGESDALVRGDSVLLGTVVANALSNALKYGEHVEVDVGEDGLMAVLRVTDDGPGVPADERERVFEPFSRAGVGSRKVVAGHGLGLALIRHVAEMHGGQASFVETKDRRTRIEVRLPTADEQ